MYAFKEAEDYVSCLFSSAFRLSLLLYVLYSLLLSPFPCTYFCLLCPADRRLAIGHLCAGRLKLMKRKLLQSTKGMCFFIYVFIYLATMLDSAVGNLTTSWMTEESLIEFVQNHGNFVFATASRPTLEPTYSAIQFVPEGSPQVKAAKA
jgi:hypothetical protein